MRTINAVLCSAISVLFFIGMGALSSCNQYTKKAAQADLVKISINYQELLAGYCGDTYPVITKTDSTQYKNSKRVIDSLADQIRIDSLLTNEERDGLWQEIVRLQRIFHDSLTATPTNCDSLSEAIYRLAAKEKKRGDRLEQLNQQLQKAASNLKPVIDTVENTARLDECRIIKDKAIASETEERKSKESWKSKAKTRGGIMWALILLVVGAVGYKAYTFFKPKLLK